MGVTPERAYRVLYIPDISLQNPFAHVHWEVLTHNNPNGGIYEIDPRRSLRPTPLFECGSPLRRAEHRTMRVLAFVSGAWYPGATRQWLPRLPSCERNSDEQFR